MTLLYFTQLFMCFVLPKMLRKSEERLDVKLGEAALGTREGRQGSNGVATYSWMTSYETFISFLGEKNLLLPLSPVFAQYSI